jgi:hypothetical protein
MHLGIASLQFGLMKSKAKKRDKYVVGIIFEVHSTKKEDIFSTQPVRK